MPSLSILIPLGVYLAASLLTFLAFARDKHAAASNRRRTPERTLHTLELLGGFPGALAAMLTLRHKTRKPAFVAITLSITVLHVAAWAFYLVT